MLVLLLTSVRVPLQLIRFISTDSKDSQLYDCFRDSANGDGDVALSGRERDPIDWLSREQQKLLI